MAVSVTTIVVCPDVPSEVVVNTVGELLVELVVGDAVSVDVVGVGVDVEVGVGVDEVVSGGVELLVVLVVGSLLGVGDGVVEVVSDVDVEGSEMLLLLLLMLVVVGVAAGMSAGVDLAFPFDSAIMTGREVSRNPSAISSRHSRVNAM